MIINHLSSLQKIILIFVILTSSHLANTLPNAINMRLHPASQPTHVFSTLVPETLDPAAWEVIINTKNDDIHHHHHHHHHHHYPHHHHHISIIINSIQLPCRPMSFRPSCLRRSISLDEKW